MEAKDILQDLPYLFYNNASPNITFRNFAKCDTFPLFDATKNIEFNKFLPWSAPNSNSDLTIEVEKLILEEKRMESISISICEKNLGTWFGFIKIAPFREAFQISYWTHPNYWKNILIKEAIVSAIEIYFSHKENKNLYARMQKQHIKSKKLLEFLGFEKIDTGTIKNDLGNNFDFDIFNLNKNDWKHKKNINKY